MLATVKAAGSWVCYAFMLMGTTTVTPAVLDHCGELVLEITGSSHLTTPRDRGSVSVRWVSGSGSKWHSGRGE
jgi:hypothetical protein